MGELAADPRRDKSLRQVAEALMREIFSRLIHITGGYNMVQDIRVNGYYRTQLDFMAPEDLSDLGLPQRFRFTVFFFAENDPGREGRYAAFGTDLEGRDAVMFWVLPPAAELFAGLQPEALWRYILRVVDARKGHIIHELTHMLDKLRGSEPLKKKKKEEPPETRAEAEEPHRRYINSPAEFNAMFQQGMYDLSEFIEHASKGETAYIMRSFRNFSRAADKMMGIAVMRGHIEGKYLKKLEARLWQTYEFWKKEMEKT